MQVVFDMPHVFGRSSPLTANAHALRSMLNCLIELDIIYLLDHAAPTLYQSGVIYGRTRVWDTIPAILKRGYGDCKSLTAWKVAEYRKRGVLAGAVFRGKKNSSGGLDFHILVQTENGYEDPSKVLGMGRNENGPY